MQQPQIVPQVNLIDAHSYMLPSIVSNIPAADTNDPIPSVQSNPLVETTDEQNNLQSVPSTATTSTAYSNELLQLYPNVEYSMNDNSPCINPNFSKIIDLPVTPSPPLADIDESVEAEENPQNDSIPNPTNQNNESTEPKIPLSHLITTNQYPSLNRIPPANIVRSFAPVYVQSNQQQAIPSNQNEDLYSSYMNDPYNLTLHVEQNFSNNTMNTDALATSTAEAENSITLANEENILTNSNISSSAVNNNTNMNIFQSATYFGTTSDTSIPPGSEMLFGQP